MPFITKQLSHLICCVSSQQPDESDLNANLNTMQGHSAISVHLPPDTVPHASGKRKQSTTDNDMLEELFRSSSSVRGYQTASESMHLPVPKRSSFDIDFKFCSKDSEPKPPSRLEQLGSHIKQRISEGRLGITSPRGPPGLKEASQNPSDIHPSSLGVDIAEASMSQHSNGLLELLMSRTGTEGGYDSDAKSIRTTMLKGGDATLRLSPLLAKELPNSLDIPVTARLSPSRSLGGDMQTKDDVEKASIDLDFLTIPGQKIFTEALLAEKDSAPMIALQRLSTGISNGTIKLPSSFNSNSTLNHIAMREKDPASVASLASPELSYSTDEQVEILSTLKRLSTTVTATQMDGVNSNPDDGVRASIVSNLDPTFIEFIAKFAELDPKSNDLGSSDPHCDPGTIFLREKSSGDLPSLTDSEPQKKDVSSSRNLTSGHDSDQLSVHLFNMRISQNLASPSLIAVSRPTTSHTTISHLQRPSMDVAIPAKRQSASGHLSSRVTAEHNRRPSDPQTRRLFELGHQAENMRSQWKTVTSFGSGASGLSFKPNRVGDDGSSFYWSDGEVGPANNSLRNCPGRNINSLAIGGRSESVSLPVSSSLNNIGNPSGTEEATWFGRRYSNKASDCGHAGLGVSPRSRSTSMPERAKLQPHESSTRHRGRRSTNDDEDLSEISTGALEDARIERLTEISAHAILDSHSEPMSELNHSPTFETRNWDFSLGDAVSSNRRRSSNILAHSLNARTHWQRKGSGSGATHDPSSPDFLFLDSASDMWQRSFRQAVAKPLYENVGGFLTAPKYDRDGRRRSSKTSSLSNVDRDEVLPEESHSEANSKNAKPTSRPNGDVEAQQTLLQPSPVQTENNKRKKSFLDIGRRFTSTIPNNDLEIRPGTTTPLKDIFGL
ncbi:uncharacterized protein A1O9_07612 [Exophiala aquamarina CBS 119918]|uniref:Uncharacterized protein n=1 Tax=Exophiala aquamarina CBS 119918 TaxID=1182545 RepID=A0A072P842_9EURO|nr:uncharacterized protein A1O9_07612 [Exophiala aquamarina CBS 119918]KEF56031.1 hypothetical protein A1O9_07612 [Exophiala aquamarina CBS 119918]